VATLHLTVNVVLFFWLTLLINQESKWLHFLEKEIFLFFSRAPCIIRTTNFFGKSSRLMSRQVEDRQQLLGWYIQWSKTPEAEASLVGRRSSACCFIIHGARGLAVGDIPPDTLMAIHDLHHPRWPGPQD
jgi:hypothetical protein